MMEAASLPEDPQQSYSANIKLDNDSTTCTPQFAHERFNLTTTSTLQSHQLLPLRIITPGNPTKPLLGWPMATGSFLQGKVMAKKQAERRASGLLGVSSMTQSLKEMEDDTAIQNLRLDVREEL